MKLLNVSLTTACNKHCYYCPIKKWLRPKGYKYPKERTLDNESLLSYFDEYIDNDCFIEYSGGEPALYKGIEKLIKETCKKGYHGIIKTNGSLYIPKSKNFKRVAAWHYGERIPKYYDEILIIENPRDIWKDKAEYCKRKTIPYKTVLFDQGFEGVFFDNERLSDHKVSEYLHINNVGQIFPCPRGKTFTSIYDMIPPVFSKPCDKCKNINDVELFIDKDAP